MAFTKSTWNENLLFCYKLFAKAGCVRLFLLLGAPREALGETPVWFLNTTLKYSTCLKPVGSATSRNVRSLCVSRSATLASRTRNLVVRNSAHQKRERARGVFVARLGPPDQ